MRLLMIIIKKNNFEGRGVQARLPVLYKRSDLQILKNLLGKCKWQALIFVISENNGDKQTELYLPPQEKPSANIPTTKSIIS
jgi:hypothetical protein